MLLSTTVLYDMGIVGIISNMGIVDIISNMGIVGIVSIINNIARYCRHY